jgi:fructokinase
VAWDFIRWENGLTHLAQKTDAVCFGSLAQRNGQSKDSIQQFLSAVPKSCLKVFDINLRQQYYTPETIEKSLQQANILKLNEDELPVLASFFPVEGSVETQLDKIRERFDLEYIAYTMGSKGSLLQNKHESSWLKAPKVKVADAVGAGDAFTAVFVAGILNDVPLGLTHQNANRVSAFVCTCKGATPTINDELLKFNL